jgi:creatinine amidohydrolase
MIWDQLTSPEIDALGRRIPVVLPIAATEQHGSHLPVATDRMIGAHFAHQLHLALPDQVLILPAVGIGCSKHHMDFTGTLTLSHETFILQVEEIVQSVIHHGFSSIILLNSHGGNQGVGQVLVEKLGYKYPQCEMVMTSWWHLGREELLDITETGFGGVGHAGEFETSLIMQIAPDLVNHQKLTDGANQPGYSWAEGDLLHSPRVSHFRTMKQMTPNGTFGDPRAASSEKGEKITEIVVKNLKGLVQDLLSK